MASISREAYSDYAVWRMTVKTVILTAWNSVQESTKRLAAVLQAMEYGINEQGSPF